MTCPRNSGRSERYGRMRVIELCRSGLKCAVNMSKYKINVMLKTIFFLAGSLVFADTEARELPEFTDLVERYSNSIVNVSAVRKAQSVTQQQFGSSPEEMEEFFRRFFPSPPRDSQAPPQSMGSGFIITDDGYILTNNHVVEDAESVVVRMIDRSEMEAEVIGTDPRSDLALLKVNAESLPAVEIGSSEELKVGEWVLAIGSPFGFDYSVTAGIVSAKRRSLRDQNNESYVPFIQTDVAINPGNSGGPLFNLRGEVVGINSQIYTRSGGFMGVSFAIPIDIAMDVADQLMETGVVSRGWLGVAIQEVDRDLAESFGLDRPHGAVVTQVMENSPAKKAGIQEGDIIVGFNDREIEFSGDLPAIVGRLRAGTTSNMDVVRDGEHVLLSVKVGEAPTNANGPLIGSLDSVESSTSYLGLTVESLGKKVEERGTMAVRAGVRVLRAEGAAKEAGIRQGDIIEKLDGQTVPDVAVFGEIARKLEAGRMVKVLVVRNQRKRFLALRVPKIE